MRVAVILSTYNGEKYLKEQLDSVLKQENVEVDIYVRDDGSTDNTVHILKEYSKENKNVFVEYGNNIGFRRSFMDRLLQITQQYDMYAFCDQDDYWEKDKLFRAQILLEKFLNTEIPALYYSNLKLCDNNLNKKHITKLHKRKQSLQSVILRRSIAGCTMVFNYSLLKLLQKEKITDNVLLRGHDSFLVSLCYAVNGKVICDSNSYIKYRKHDNNTSMSTNTFYDRIRKEYETLIKKKGQESIIADELLKNWNGIINNKNKVILQNIKEVRCLKNRFKICIDFNYRTGDFLLTIVGKLKVLCGLL